MMMMTRWQTARPGGMGQTSKCWLAMLQGVVSSSSSKVRRKGDEPIGGWRDGLGWVGVDSGCGPATIAS